MPEPSWISWKEDWNRTNKMTKFGSFMLSAFPKTYWFFVRWVYYGGQRYHRYDEY